MLVLTFPVLNIDLCLLMNLGKDAGGVQTECRRVSGGLLPCLPSGERVLR